MKRLVLVSSDCHAGLLTENYPLYFESKYQEQLADFLTEHKNLNGVRKDRSTTDLGAIARQQDYESRIMYATQLDKRVAALEADGFVAEVLFPDASVEDVIPFGAHFGGIGDYPTELHWAALRAYNRWLGETAVPGRQIGLALIPLLDPTYAAEQVRSARSLGLLGVMPQWDGVDPSFLPLYDRQFDPMWAACVDNRLSVNFHSGCGVPERMYDPLRETAEGKVVASTENKFWCRRPLWHLIFGGVLERHPELRVGFVEMFADWVPRTLAHMDTIWQTRHTDKDFAAVCPQLPSQYWARQCFVSASPISLLEAQETHEFAPGTLTYGTDFPHAASPWGKCTEYLQATIGAAGVTEDEARAILGENTIKIYDLDAAKLAEIAERVGPTVDQILGTQNASELTDEMTAYIQLKVSRPASML